MSLCVCVRACVRHVCARLRRFLWSVPTRETSGAVAAANWTCLKDFFWRVKWEAEDEEDEEKEEEEEVRREEEEEELLVERQRVAERERDIH